MRVFGARDYAMRIWLDPEKVAARDLTAGEVVAAIRAQNVQVASGVLNQPPIPTDAAFQLNVETEGRFDDTDDFERIVVKTDPDGRVTRIADIGRVELGAQDYSANGYLDERPAVPLLVFQRPGSNALATADQLIATMQELAQDFPEGLQYDIVYNPTEFVAQSVEAVRTTIYEAVVLVILVMIVFLQSWRTAIVPIVAIPVSLIGTFAVMAALGFSINNLTLFGLVLAIGIVVDDAIVVVENVERNLRAGLSPREAAHRTIDEVAGPIIATFLVLAAVFVPAAFIPGISGQFFRQFAVTIAVSTAISTWVSLSLSPALCALLLKPHEAHAQRRTPLLLKPVSWFFAGFNWLFEKFSLGYGGLTRRLVRIPLIVLVVYAGLIGLTGYQFSRAPTGFIPEQDQGYLITVLQLPPGASLGRTDAVVREAAKIILDTPGVAHAVPFAGFDGATFTNAPNAGAIFSGLAPFEDRVEAGLDAPTILQDLNARLGGIQEAFIITIMPPPVRGIGTGGGFKMMVEDQRARGAAALDAVTQEIVAAANQEPGLAGVFSVFNTRTPKIYADIDLVRAEMLGVTPEHVFEALEVYLGSVLHQRLQLPGPDLPGPHAGRRRVPAESARCRQPEDPQRRGRHGALELGRELRRPHRALPGAALQPLSGGRGPGCDPARHVDGRGARTHGGAGRGDLAGGLRLRVDRARAAGAPGRRHRAAGVRRRRDLRVPGARRPVRELDAAAGRDPDRADVPAGCGERPRPARHRHQHPLADRLRGADRARRQERDPDRRVRKAARATKAATAGRPRSRRRRSACGRS